MSRFLGGLFGNTDPVSPGSAGPGRFDYNGQYYLSEQGNWVAPMNASGGNVDGTEPGNGYKYHVYTGPGTFVVSSAGNADCLVVGGGGAGGRQHGGGGGGGSVVHWESMPMDAGTYPVFVGEGGTVPWPGSGDVPGHPNTAESGGNSYINTVPGTVYVRAGGGMGGGTWFSAAKTNPVGGSGGGSTAGPPTQQPAPQGGTPTAAVAPSTSPASAGVTDPGGKSYQNASGDGAGGGSGGGGAGGEGGDTAPSNASGDGGNGQPFPGFALPLFPTLPTPAKNASGPTGLFGGGGGGGSDNVGASAGGDGIVIIRYLAS